MSEDRVESPQREPRFAFEERRRGDRRGWPAAPAGVELGAAATSRADGLTPAWPGSCFSD